MPGPSVIIVDEGGVPVIPVTDRAPVVTIYEPPEGEAPRGTPITLVEDHGTPFIIEGYEADSPFALSSDDGSNLVDDNDGLMETYNGLGTT